MPRARPKQPSGAALTGLQDCHSAVSVACGTIARMEASDGEPHAVPSTTHRRCVPIEPFSGVSS
ncbi:hypothetical protein C6P97_31485 [Burkholderia multivorans]|uniref:Uncharacterized protein n=1 Tax=Burkholderia multivorans TaxID=87883 RepID=A0AB37AVP6_9BURK|nr:hypothetical protein C6P97_31485 [Burkholderia multivorans]PRE53074.1 hypothetical protein C6P99_06385 [Burkholderia multivorans]